MWRWDGARPSRSSATTTPLPTAPAFATTSTSPTLPTRICWRLQRSTSDAAAERHPTPLIYNLGNGKGFSVREVIESARRVTGHPIPAEIHPRRAGRPRSAGGQLGESHPRTGLEAALHPARRHHPHRLDLAPEALRGIEQLAGGFLHLSPGLASQKVGCDSR